MRWLYSGSSVPPFLASQMASVITQVRSETLPPFLLLPAADFTCAPAVSGKTQWHVPG